MSNKFESFADVLMKEVDRTDVEHLMDGLRADIVAYLKWAATEVSFWTIEHVNENAKDIIAEYWEVLEYWQDDQTGRSEVPWQNE